MTREDILKLAAPFFTYADTTPTIRGADDLWRFALLVESLVYSRESSLFAEKSTGTHRLAAACADSLDPSVR